MARVPPGSGCGGQGVPHARLLVPRLRRLPAAALADRPRHLEEVDLVQPARRIGVTILGAVDDPLDDAFLQSLQSATMRSFPWLPASTVTSVNGISVCLPRQPRRHRPALAFGHLGAQRRHEQGGIRRRIAEDLEHDPVRPPRQRPPPPPPPPPPPGRVGSSTTDTPHGHVDRSRVARCFYRVSEANHTANHTAEMCVVPGAAAQHTAGGGRSGPRDRLPARREPPVPEDRTAQPPRVGVRRGRHPGAHSLPPPLPA